VTRISVSFWFALAGIGLGACGGSSSETPFPLEPDFGHMDAGGPPSDTKYVVFSGSAPSNAGDSGAATPEPAPEEE